MHLLHIFRLTMNFLSLETHVKVYNLLTYFCVYNFTNQCVIIPIKISINNIKLLTFYISSIIIERLYTFDKKILQTDKLSMN